jgi:hypothetical protein
MQLAYSLDTENRKQMMCKLGVNQYIDIYLPCDTQYSCNSIWGKVYNVGFKVVNWYSLITLMWLNKSISVFNTSVH